MDIDEGTLMEFLNRFVGDLGAHTMAAGSVVVGDRLGLYRALAESGRMRPADLAERTGTAARYVEEWLRGQAAGGYVEYDAATGDYSLTEEQAFALTNPDGPVFAPGAFQLAVAALPRRAGDHRGVPLPGPGWAGTPTTTGCSTAASGSSAPGTAPASSARGCPRCPGWRRKTDRPARAWPTSAAGTGPRRC